MKKRPASALPAVDVEAARDAKAIVDAGAAVDAAANIVTSATPTTPDNAETQRRNFLFAPTVFIQTPL